MTTQAGRSLLTGRRAREERSHHGPNAMNCVPNPNYSYTTTNMAEAMPGPASPLGWSLWAAPADVSGRAPLVRARRDLQVGDGVLRPIRSTGS